MTNNNQQNQNQQNRNQQNQQNQNQQISRTTRIKTRTRTAMSKPQRAESNENRREENR